LRKLRQSFGLKITVLLRATFLLSNGDNIIAHNFERFPAIDTKGRQAATGNRASCPRQQQKLKIKASGRQTFVALDSTDNRSKFKI